MKVGVMIDISFSGYVWESEEAQRKGIGKSRRFFKYSSEFQMPAAPTPGLGFRFAPSSGGWLRFWLENVEWDVVRGIFLCSARDLLLQQLSGYATLALASARFLECGLTVDRTDLDASDAERIRRQNAKAIAKAEAEAVVDAVEQGKFEQKVQTFSDLDSDDRDALRRAFTK
jgi:hypothetical protein